jgi:hypothetical protein
MRIPINSNYLIQGQTEPDYLTESMELEVVHSEVIDCDLIDLTFTDHDGFTITKEFEFFSVWKEGEEGEYSCFKSLCGEFAIYVATSMGEAVEGAKIIEIEYIG